MSLLTKKEIKQVKDHTTQEVEVPEWNGSVLVRSMTARERDEFEAEMLLQAEGKKPASVRARFVMICCVDESGNRIFNEADLPWLENKSFAPMQRIADVVRKISKLTVEDVEELEKNLEKDRAESSNSDSV